MSKIRCLVIAHGNIAGQSGYIHRVLTMVRRLEELGYLPVVLWYSRLATAFGKGVFGRTQSRRTTFINIPMPPLSSMHISLCRVTRVLSALAALIVIKLLHIDVVLAENPTVASIAAGMGVPVVCDFHGDYVEERKLVTSSQWKSRLAHQDERVACSESVGWLCASNALGEVLSERHCVSKPTAVVSCGVDIEEFGHYAERRITARARLGVSDRWVVCYMGGLDKWQEIPRTLSLVREMRAREPLLYFLFITHDNSDAYESELSMLGRETRDYARMTLTHDEVLELLPAADLGLLLRSPSPVNYVSSPTKCGEYLASGVPVLTTTSAGDAPLIVEETNTGLVLQDDVGSRKSAELALSFLQGIMAKREEVAEQSHLAALRHHNRDQGTANLGRLLRQVLRVG